MSEVFMDLLFTSISNTSQSNPDFLIYSFGLFSQLFHALKVQDAHSLIYKSERDIKGNIKNEGIAIKYEGDGKRIV